MATIREMIKNMHYPTLAEKAAYWDGANAALEEVENYMYEILSGTSYALILKSKIKELKGE